MAVLFEERRQVAPEIIEVFGDPVGHVGILGLRPHELDRIKFRRIGRQPARLEPGAACSAQLSGGGTVSVQAVPDQQHGSPQVRMNMSKKSHQINRVAVVIQQLVVQAKALFPRGHRQGANHAQTVMPVPGIADRSLSDGSPNPAPQGLQKEATFVEKNNASFSLGSLFCLFSRICG